MHHAIVSMYTQCDKTYQWGEIAQHRQETDQVIRAQGLDKRASLSFSKLRAESQTLVGHSFKAKLIGNLGVGGVHHSTSNGVHVLVLKATCLLVPQSIQVIH